MKKNIVFDMDGTIANLYSVENWLPKLREYDASPYVEAEPMCDMIELRDTLIKCKDNGYTVEIVSWLSKESTPAYDKAVAKAKELWLKVVGLWDVIDHFHFVAYGTDKRTASTAHDGILFDDNAEVRDAWGEGAIDPGIGIVETLNNLLT